MVRHQHQEKLLHESEKARAAAEMAHKLAHRINNPLQSLANAIYLAQHSTENTEYLAQAEAELRSLASQVALLLANPAK